MAEEASEKLVRQYLENLGYLVLSNRQYIFQEKKVKRGQPLRASADIIAVLPSVNKDNKLPKKLHKKMIIEVKGWLGTFSINYFKDKRNRRGYFNILAKYDKHKRAKYLKKRIEKQYGHGFHFVLVVNNIKKNNRDLNSFLKKQKITLLTFQNDIIPGLISQMRNKMARHTESKTKEYSEYENDPTSQFMRFLLYNTKQCKLCGQRHHKIQQ